MESPPKKELVYFNPGNVVKVKHLPDSPLMVVKQANKFWDAASGSGKLLGIRCYWFSSTGTYHEEVFSSKDLSKIE